MKDLEEKIKKCIEPIINNLGYNLYDVIYEKEDNDNYLRIFIDIMNKEDDNQNTSICLDDCENVNNSITDILDEKDFIKEEYFLEVSSPGVEKRIRNDEHLKQNIEKKVEIQLFKKEYNKKVLTGILKEYDEKTITIEISNEMSQKEKKDKFNKRKKKNQREIKQTTNNKEQTNDNETKFVIEKNNISNMKTIFNWEEM